MPSRAPAPSIRRRCLPSFLPLFLPHAHHDLVCFPLQTKLRAACLGVKIRAENGLENALESLSLFARRREWCSTAPIAAEPQAEPQAEPPPQPDSMVTETVADQRGTAAATSAVGFVSTECTGGGVASAGGVSHGGMSPRGGGGGGGVRGGEGEFVLREMPNGLRVWWSSRAEEEAFFIFGEVFEDRTYARMGVRVQDGDTVWDIGENR